MKRPMDDVVITAGSPQEDEFALLGLGARSPYEALLFPKKLEAAFALADPEDLPPEEHQAWVRTFLFFTNGISSLGGNRQVIFKSPTHSYRLKTLMALMPTAKFILISRNPSEVFESTFRMWRSLFKLYALGEDISDSDLRNFILENRIKMEAKISAGKAALTDKNCIHVKYEDIVKQPTDQLKRIYSAFNLNPSYLESTELRQKIRDAQTYSAKSQKPPQEWEKRIKDCWADYS